MQKKTEIILRERKKRGFSLLKKEPSMGSFFFCALKTAHPGLHSSWKTTKVFRQGL